MRTAGLALILAAFLLASSWAGGGPEALPAFRPGWRDEPIKPLPPATGLNTAKVELGRALFHERRLSRDNTVSCSTCHDLSQGGADSAKHSIGINGNEGVINAPTVFNSAYNFRQFWDGRALTLEEQIDGPVQSSHEMGSTWPEVVEKLRADAGYPKDFARLYPEGISARTIKDAIAHFERSLVTPDSRFDDYLRGDETALTAEEKSGYQQFKTHGCVSCHQGVNVGGNMFAPLGAMANYFADRGGVTKADYGRFNVTGREEDRYLFKVPSLRNVARTAPYLHDGSALRLEDAVRTMGKYQLGQELSSAEVELIAKFLRTLTGEYGGRPL